MTEREISVRLTETIDHAKKTKADMETAAQKSGRHREMTLERVRCILIGTAVSLLLTGNAG